MKAQTTQISKTDIKNIIKYLTISAAFFEAEAEEAAKAEEARRQQELNERAKAQMEAQMQTGDLFDQAAAAVPVQQAETYVPKASVKYICKPLDVDAIPEIIAMWWKYEGCKLPLEELTKTFKKQITFASKLANDKIRPERILSPYVTYVEEIKAK